MWTFNIPTDHAKIRYDGVWVPESAILGELDSGLAVAQHFVDENRTRQAASSLVAAQYCIDEAVRYTCECKPFGKALATNQVIAQGQHMQLQSQPPGLQRRQFCHAGARRNEVFAAQTL
jgi:alkylation response protein AidB-like acyl-CoA dehydrogenase